MSDDLQRLLDRQAMDDVMVRFTRAIDRKDWELFASCFQEDVEADYSQSAGKHGLEFPPLKGVQAMIGGAQATFASLTTQHYVSNPYCEIEGDRARYDCHVMALHTNEAGENFLQSGRYEDIFVRTDDGWKISYHVHHEVYTEGDPAVLIAPMTGA